ncbi:MAG: ATP-dependent Clp protease adaptor ClpS [Sphingomonas sp.]|nr:ATP-dependent Clp protease adaptor ClpS [Sphingomonas sp.]
MVDKVIPDLVRLKLLNDQTTPYPFVIALLENVFGKAPLDAQLTATNAHHYGEADCGLWPSAVADALLATAQARINEAGHRLAFSRSAADGYEVVGQDSCTVCGKPEGHTGYMYRKGDVLICDGCILDASEHFSDAVSFTQFKHAYEALSAHFGAMGLSDIETSVRSFPLRMRADLQLGFDQILSPNTTRQLGIKAGYRYQSMEFADLWETGNSAQIIVPVQYAELDVGDESPRRCVGTALWLLDKDGMKHAVFVSQEEGMRGDPRVKMEIAVPTGQAGAGLVASYFRDIERVIEKAESYRGKVLSLEMDSRWQGLAGGITIHRLPQIAKEDVILPENALALLDHNVLDFAALRPKLRAMGQPTKKGLLFYGPPGTGKTHTIQYLATSLSGHTTLLVTADQVCLLNEYFGLARLLQPSVLVIEDADLIARDREDMRGAGEEALLNKLLNEMDGLRQDADIFFVLTTNRPEHLEPALAGRPGRVDQAIEFPLPDEQGRLKLALLYGGELQLDEGVREKIVQRTKGVSAAFIKELMRRISQRVIEDGTADRLASEAHVLAALDEMIFAGGTLNAQLLGAGGIG